MRCELCNGTKSNEAPAICPDCGGSGVARHDRYVEHITSEIRRLQHLLQVYLQERAQGVVRKGG